MTTFTVDIKKDGDIDLIKNFLSEKGFDYAVAADEDFVCSDDIKNMLHEREEEYLRSERKMVTPEESRAEIQKILSDGK